MGESDKTINISEAQAAFQQRLGLEDKWAAGLPATYLASLPGAQTAGKQANASRAYGTPAAGAAAEASGVFTSDHAAALDTTTEAGASGGENPVVGRATPPTVSRPEIRLKEWAAGGRPAPTPTLYGYPRHRKQDREPVRHRRARRHIVAFAAGAVLVGGGIFAATELFPQKTSQVTEWLTDRSDEIADTISDNL